jgi:glutamate 5-kinase
MTAKIRGSIQIDSGAASAIIEKNAGLLPIGITGISGLFEMGDVAAVIGPDGNEIARGVVQYSSAEIKQIMGLQSDEIHEKLGYSNGRNVIHRDDLVCQEKKLTR